MNKRQKLENQYSNELVFQKQLLKSKNHDLIESNTFDLKNVQNDCEKFYLRTFEKELIYAKERNNIFETKDKSYYIKRKEKKNNTYLYSKNEKEKLLNRSINNNNSEYYFGNINKNNYKCIDKLFNDIVYLSQKEKNIEKRYGKSK